MAAVKLFLLCGGFSYYWRFYCISLTWSRLVIIRLIGAERPTSLSPLWSLFRGLTVIAFATHLFGILVSLDLEQAVSETYSLCVAGQLHCDGSHAQPYASKRSFSRCIASQNSPGTLVRQCKKVPISQS